MLCGHGAPPAVRSSRPLRLLASWTAVVAILVALATSCSQRTAGPGGIEGRIVATDGRVGVSCMIEVNSVDSPFYAPGIVEARTGDRFAWSCSGDDTIEAVYAAVQCEGYEPSLASQLSVRCTRRLHLGDIAVRPASTDRAGPGPNGTLGAAQR